MGGFTKAQAEQYARDINPDGSVEQQRKIAETLFEVMRSPEFALKYSEVISKFFDEEECIRLAKILKDPVLKSSNKTDWRTRKMLWQLLKKCYLINLKSKVTNVQKLSEHKKGR
ncbi:hypothetical protein [Shewanella atlantica]|uniref:hypothetical protein n=1 Tax=Shewanella atlantica TaxID=271099 RepID=UPI00373654F7